MSNASAIAVSLWNAMEARDWSAVAALLSPELRVEYPQSGERFDREGYLTLNKDYPGNWHIRVRHVVDGGAWVVTEVEVDIDDRIDRAVSFFQIRDGQVVALREFWPEPFPAPEWRKGLTLKGE